MNLSRQDRVDRYVRAAARIANDVRVTLVNPELGIDATRKALIHTDV